MSAPPYTNGRLMTVTVGDDLDLSAGVNVICVSNRAFIDSSWAFQPARWQLNSTGLGPGTVIFEVIFGTGLASIDCLHPVTTNATMQINVTIMNSPGATATGTKNYSWTEPPGSVKVGGTGSYSMTFQAQEFWEPFSWGSGTSILNYIYPNFGGTPKASGLPMNAVLYYIQSVPGTTLTATITIDGLTVTASCVPSSTFGGNFGINGILGGGAHNTSKTGFINYGLGTGGSKITFGAPYTVSDATTSADFTNGLKLTVNQSGSAPCSASLSLGASAPIRYQLNAKMGVFDADYPTSLQLLWNDQLGHTQTVTAGPTATAHATQQIYNAQATLNGVVEPGLFANQIAPVSVSISTASLATNGDDQTDWRLPILGFKWNALTLSNASSVTVKAAHSFTTSETFTPAITNFEGHRYLVFMSDSAGTLTLTPFNGTARFWNVVVGLNIIDLRCPQAIPGMGWNQDDRQSRYPLHTAPGGADPTPDETGSDAVRGVFWGAMGVASITLTTGGTASIGDMKLTRRNYSNASFVQQFDDLMPAYTSGTTIVTMEPFARLLTDDRYTDIPGFYRNDPSGGTSTFTYPSISDLAALINTIGGMTATAAGATGDGYHDSTLEALRLGGGGLMFDYPTATWSKAMFMDTSSALSVPAQDQWDYVQVYPGAGEVWSGSGPFYVETPLAVGKLLRGLAHGCIFDSATFLPVPSASVQAKGTSGSPLYGSGSSNADGYYKTGTPWGPGKVTVRTQLQAGAMQYFDQTWSNRRWTSVSFTDARRSALGCWHEYDEGAGMNLACIKDDNTIDHSFFQSTWPPATTVINLESGVLDAQFLVKQDGQSLLVYVITKSDGVHYGLMLDDGATITSTILIAANGMNTNCCQCGPYIFVGYTVPVSGTSGPSNVWVQRRKAGDFSLDGTWELKDSGGTPIVVVDGQFGLAAPSPDQLVLSVVKNGDTAPSLFCSVNDAEDWFAI